MAYGTSPEVIAKATRPMIGRVAPGPLPELSPCVFVAPGAAIIGDVKIGRKSSVWFNCVIRGDNDTIEIGEDTNIQDLSCLHVDTGCPLIIGNRVVVGHQAIVHGCTIDDECLIGCGAIVMNKAKLGRGCVVGAGAVVLEGFEAPPYSLLVGCPAKIKKKLLKEHAHEIRQQALAYTNNAQEYMNALQFTSQEGTTLSPEQPVVQSYQHVIAAAVGAFAALLVSRLIR